MSGAIEQLEPMIIGLLNSVSWWMNIGSNGGMKYCNADNCNISGDIFSEEWKSDYTNVWIFMGDDDGCLHRLICRCRLCPLLFRLFLLLLGLFAFGFAPSNTRKTKDDGKTHDGGLPLGVFVVSIRRDNWLSCTPLKDRSAFFESRKLLIRFNYTWFIVDVYLTLKAFSSFVSNHRAMPSRQQLNPSVINSNPLCLMWRHNRYLLLAHYFDPSVSIICLLLYVRCGMCWSTNAFQMILVHYDSIFQNVDSKHWKCINAQHHCRHCYQYYLHFIASSVVFLCIKCPSMVSHRKCFSVETLALVVCDYQPLHNCFPLKSGWKKTAFWIFKELCLSNLIDSHWVISTRSRQDNWNWIQNMESVRFVLFLLPFARCRNRSTRGCCSGEMISYELTKSLIELVGWLEEVEEEQEKEGRVTVNAIELIAAWETAPPSVERCRPPKRPSIRVAVRRAPSSHRQRQGQMALFRTDVLPYYISSNRTINKATTYKRKTGRKAEPNKTYSTIIPKLFWTIKCSRYHAERPWEWRRGEH